jgi:hypothetical protein
MTQRVFIMISSYCIVKTRFVMLLIWNSKQFQLYVSWLSCGFSKEFS